MTENDLGIFVEWIISIGLIVCLAAILVSLAFIAINTITNESFPWNILIAIGVEILGVIVFGICYSIIVEDRIRQNRSK